MATSQIDTKSQAAQIPTKTTGSASAEAKAKANAHTEERRRAKAEQKAKAKAEKAAKAKAKLIAKIERKAKLEAKKRVKAEAKAIAKIKKKAKAKAEKKIRTETRARAKAGMREKARAYAQARLKAEMREKADVEKGVRLQKVSSLNETAAKQEAVPFTIKEKATLNNTGALLAICSEDIMEKDVVWASPDDSVQQVLTKMRQRNTSYMMIGRDGVPEGIVSKSDLTGTISPYLQPVSAKWRLPSGDATLQIKIKWIMTRPVHTIHPETSLAAMMTKMRQLGVQCLPVTDQQGKVQGLVTAFNILKIKALLKLESSPHFPIAGKTASISGRYMSLPATSAIRRENTAATVLTSS